MAKLGGFLASDFIGALNGTRLTDAIRGPSANGPVVTVANSEAIFVGAVEGIAHPIIAVDIRQEHIDIIQAILKIAGKSAEYESEEDQIEDWEERLEKKYTDADSLISKFEARTACKVEALAARATHFHCIQGDVASPETAAKIREIVGQTPLGVIYASNIEHYVGVDITVFPDNSINSARTKGQYRKCILDLMSPNTTLISGPLNMNVYGNKTLATEKWLSQH